MKQFRRIIIRVFLAWLIIAGLTAMLIHQIEKKKQSKEYLVEINRIHEVFLRQKSFLEVDCTKYKYIKQVDYLPIEYAGLSKNQYEETKENDSEEQNSCISYFYYGKEILSLGILKIPKECKYEIMPLVIASDLMGFVRYSYVALTNNSVVKLLFVIEIILAGVFVFTLGLLLYLQKALLKPFHEISELPYELSKGHLPLGLKETKNQYFGKFIWGLNLLRESLEEHRRKELQLEKDKKLMILSVSHDIKTPLSTIKLYSRALYEDLYDNEEKKKDTAKRIEEKADQIEAFVSEIVKTSSSELFEFDIKIEEFYLKNLLVTIQRAYTEKLKLLKTDFEMGTFKNKLLSGDQDKLIDVFDNIIQNAVKYGDGKEIRISFEEEDNYQLIRVTNSGQPINSYNLHHMFESFWRGENAIGKPGNGLGLYICKKIMQKMEGDIYAEAGDYSMSFVVVLKKV